MVRDSDDGPGYGDADGHVSRETGIEGWGVRPTGRPVPQPRAEYGDSSRPVEPVRFEAPGSPSATPAPVSPTVPHAVPPRNPVSAPPHGSPTRSDAESTRGGTVDFQVAAPNDRGATGTLYGRGVSPTVDASQAEVRPERRNPPSPRPHPSVVTADTEGAMTDAYVSRETEDPPLAQEAKRAVEILNPSGEITMPRPPRRRTMCVANQKGGVGKTTTAVNIAVALALHGNRVLVIDLDPQGNASTGLNVPHHSGVPDVYDCLIDGAPLDAVTQQVEGIPNLWAVPATIDLAGAEIELVSVVARESRLKRAIEAGGDNYDYIFIDCPPSLGLLTVNALVAAEEVLIPIQCEYYALEGVQALTNNIELVRSHLNPHLDITTVLLTMYDRRTRLADLVEQDVRNHFGEKCLNAVIPRNVRVSEAPSYSQSVMTYDPGSRGAVSYFEAAQEIALRGAQGAQVGGVA
ncbi:AAA family ATPase [Dactylosporangium sp. CA-139114]|uniref:ParA family protein n=1 Tax=Dactylosporangium sp. CA-139114 TaxID=3239931 RepID=UPI003D99A2CE